MLNALTIDLEDWFQVSNLERLVTFDEWDDCQPHLVENTHHILRILSQTGTRATFFVLGWNAERFPGLVRDIAADGHEIASHGYAHRRVYDQQPEEFERDIDLANHAIWNAVGEAPSCYRAPSFSVTPDSVWSLAILSAAGFEADSSIFPVPHDRYGFTGAPRLPSRVKLDGAIRLTEVPPSTVVVAGTNVPFSGGAYFRLLPYPAVERLCRLLNGRGEGLVFYFHPWEFDPSIPRYRLSAFRRLLSYANLDKTAKRMRTLLRSFRFASLSDMLAETRVDIEWDPAAASGPTGKRAGGAAAAGVDHGHRGTAHGS
jgi:polysaccharide deacetylase family protein (PEP-CTERM system associated)